MLWTSFNEYLTLPTLSNVSKYTGTREVSSGTCIFCPNVVQSFDITEANQPGFLQAPDFSRGVVDL